MSSADETFTDPTTVPPQQGLIIPAATGDITLFSPIAQVAENDAVDSKSTVSEPVDQLQSLFYGNEDESIESNDQSASAIPPLNALYSTPESPFQGHNPAPNRGGVNTAASFPTIYGSNLNATVSTTASTVPIQRNTPQEVTPTVGIVGNNYVPTTTSGLPSSVPPSRLVPQTLQFASTTGLTTAGGNSSTSQTMPPPVTAATGGGTAGVSSGTGLMPGADGGGGATNNPNPPQFYPYSPYPTPLHPSQLFSVGGGGGPDLRGYGFIPSPQLPLQSSYKDGGGQQGPYHLYNVKGGGAPQMFKMASRSLVPRSDYTLLPDNRFYHDVHYDTFISLVTYSDGKTTALIRQTATNVIAVLQTKVIIPQLNQSLSSPVQEKSCGKQIADNIKTALITGSLFDQVALTIIEQDFPLDTALMFFHDFVVKMNKQSESTLEQLTPKSKLPAHGSISFEDCVRIIRINEQSRVSELVNAINIATQKFSQKVDEDYGRRHPTSGSNDYMRMAAVADLTTKFSSTDPEVSRLRKEFDQIEIDIQRRALIEYNALQVAFQEYSLYEQHVHSHNDLVKHYNQRLESFEQTIQSLKLVIQTILGKVIDGLNRQFYSSIQKSLNGEVKIAATGALIKYPFNEQSLPGIYAALLERFYQPSLVDFLQALQELIKFRMSSSDLDKGISEMETVLNSFHKMGFWGKFMTEDNLFTLLLIQGINQEKIKIDSMEYILNIVSRGEDKSHYAGGSDQHVLFSHLKSFLLTKNASEGILNRNKDSGKTNNNGGGYHGKQQARNGRRNEYQSTVVEANAAVVPASNTTAMKVVQKTEAFPYLVNVQHGHFISDGPALKRYTATPHPCAGCTQNNNGKGTSEAHEPKCLNIRCQRCDLFGHAVGDCHQKEPNGFRNKKPNSGKGNNDNKGNSKA